MDVNTLTLREPDPIATEKYVDAGKTVIPIPPRGTYTLQCVKVDKWEATADQYLQAILTHKVVSPGSPWDGHDIRFHRINTKKWPNREGSSMADYLRAHGVPTLPTNNAGYQAAVDALVGRSFEAGTDWEIYSTEHNVKLKGMENFPKGQDGQPQPFTASATTPDKRVYANARIIFLVSKVKG
jgi:hypothetical protein